MEHDDGAFGGRHFGTDLLDCGHGNNQRHYLFPGPRQWVVPFRIQFADHTDQLADNVDYGICVYRLSSFRIWTMITSEDDSKLIGMQTEPTMKLRKLKFAVAVCCIVFTGNIWAQDAAKPSAEPAKPSAEQAQPAAAKVDSNSYVVGVDDVLAINVWKEPDVSRTVTVRSDGKISMPLVGEVQASGLTPRQLQGDLANRLKNFISEPDVTVVVQEMKSKRFNILGQVVRPGSYLLTNPITVLDAIAMCGGFRDFAKQKSIYVLRQKADGTQERLPFNYKDVIKGKNTAQNVSLEARDTIVVP